MPGDSDDRQPAAARNGPGKRTKSGDHDQTSPDKQPPPKRSRVSRACDQCRASREKCDGEQPICQTCVSQKRQCSYDEQPKKRGIQPNYIRTLELTLSWLFKTFPESEKRLSYALADPDATTRQLIAGKGGHAEALHQRWRNNVVCRQIDQMLSGTAVEHPASASATSFLQSPPLSAPSEQHNGRDGGDDIHEASLPASFTAGQTVQPRAHQQANATPTTHSRHERHRSASSQHIQPSSSSELHLNALATERLQLPDRAWTLLEYYFAFIHAWLPMTDRQATLKLMYTYPVDGVLRFDAMNGDYAELWSILALSSIIIPNHSGQFDTERLHNVARSLIPSERNVYERGHLKALVLLAILEMARQQWLAGWVLIGCAIRIILATTSSQSEAFPESHLNFGMPLRESATGDKLKHVGLAAYVVESAIAAHIGAPTHIQPEQMSMFGSLDEDGLEEWSPWHDPLSNTHGADIKTPARSYSTLNQLVRLALRNEGMGLVDFTQSSTNAVYRTILRLLQNAMQAENRLQPATIVSQSESAAQGHGGAHGPTHYASMAPGNFALDAFSAPGTSRQYTQQQLGYMSIPETTESAFSGSPLVQTGNTNPTTAGSWTQDNPAGIMSLPDTDNSTVAGADIFEELALLERTDSRSNPQFMQNLGFAPDIDLAEFFGADYQPSDPMLAYMQPSLFNPPSNGELQAPDMG